jgi:hypothetical protein
MSRHKLSLNFPVEFNDSSSAHVEFFCTNVQLSTKKLFMVLIFYNPNEPEFAKNEEEEDGDGQYE